MSMTTRRWIILAVAGTFLAATAGVSLINTASRVAHADDKCAATCNSTHDQCLASTNDRYSCDSKRNQCLKTCSGG